MARELLKGVSVRIADREDPLCDCLGVITEFLNKEEVVIETIFLHTAEQQEMFKLKEKHVFELKALKPAKGFRFILGKTRYYFYTKEEMQAFIKGVRKGKRMK